MLYKVIVGGLSEAMAKVLVEGLAPTGVSLAIEPDEAPSSTTGTRKARTSGTRRTKAEDKPKQESEARKAFRERVVARRASNKVVSEALQKAGQPINGPGWVPAKTAFAKSMAATQDESKACKAAVAASKRANGAK